MKLEAADDIELPETMLPRLVLAVEFRPATLRPWRGFRYRVGEADFDVELEASGAQPVQRDLEIEHELLASLPDKPLGRRSPWC